jgi:hypothetical protein
MKSIFMVALAFTFFAGSISAHAQTEKAPKASKASHAAKAAGKAERPRMHDRCHSRRAMMSGRAC